MNHVPKEKRGWSLEKRRALGGALQGRKILAINYCSTSSCSKLLPSPVLAITVPTLQRYRRNILGTLVTPLYNVPPAPLLRVPRHEKKSMAPAAPVEPANTGIHSNSRGNRTLLTPDRFASIAPDIPMRSVPSPGPTTFLWIY
ncbi:hypothetical protein M0804_002560 [Polistes exclamans]|nr:hypothetical protein M0804_002560 [Polistes exclamans]